MAGISAPGIGSGIDINALVSSLVEAQRAPTSNRLDLKEATLQAEITAYGTLKSALSSFNSTLGSYSSQAAFQSVSASSSDEELMTAEAGNGAAPGAYDITVTSLAKTHTLVTSGFTSATDTVGTGTLTFKSGTTDYVKDPESYNSFTPNGDKATHSVVIDSSNNTLTGVRDAINNADIGVRAGIIFDGTNYRLSFAAEDTGVKNSLEVTVDDTGDGNDTDASGLSMFAFNGAATNLEQTIAAQDAALQINGLSITSSTNTIEDAISGVTLNLNKADATKPFTLSVSKNTGVISNAVNNIVKDYNELINTISDISGYDADAGQGGILMGDSVTRNVSSQLRQVLNSALDGLGGSYRTLAEIGVTTQRDGTLEVDQSKLSAAVKKDPDAVSRLFSLAGETDNSQVSFTGSTSSTQAGDYAIEVTQAATQGVYNGATFGYSGAIAIDANNDTFALLVDGVQSASINLTQGNYTGAELATELQTRINGDSALQEDGVSVSVAFDDASDTFSITSSRYGDASKVEFTSLDGNIPSSFGLSAGKGTDGLNVAGTIGGRTATGSGRFLTGFSGAVEGLQVEVQGDSIGSYGTISFTRGIADQLGSLVDKWLASDGAISTRVTGANNRIDDIGEQRETHELRMEKLRARLMSQFIAMDSIVSQLQGTSSYLSQTLETLPTINASNN